MRDASLDTPHRETASRTDQRVTANAREDDERK